MNTIDKELAMEMSRVENEDSKVSERRMYVLNSRYNQLMDERVYIMIRKAVIVAREQFNHRKWVDMGGVVYDEVSKSFTQYNNCGDFYE